MPNAQMTAWAVVMRTLLIDELIGSALEQGEDTVVNLGAGLDTRPYRTALPSSLHWIEVDHPHLVDFKEAQLADEAPRCRLERVRGRPIPLPRPLLWPDSPSRRVPGASKREKSGRTGTGHLLLGPRD